MNFEIISEITDIEIIAVGSGIRDIARLRKQYGQGRWRKLKGIAILRLANGRIRCAEIHCEGTTEGFPLSSVFISKLKTEQIKNLSFKE
ncbi:hypothetical protein H8E77_19625 [bacterium]|nr:hypothetical protein [bacterium]